MSIPVRDKPEVWMHKQVYRKFLKYIMNQVDLNDKENSKEVIGLLTGRCDKDRIMITDVICEDIGLNNSYVKAGNFEPFEEELTQILARGEYVVGWVHSHPGHGLYLSSTDIETQKNYEHWDNEIISTVSVVIDPFETQYGGGQGGSGASAFKTIGTNGKTSYYEIPLKIPGLKDFKAELRSLITDLVKQSKEKTEKKEPFENVSLSELKTRILNYFLKHPDTTCTFSELVSQFKTGTKRTLDELTKHRLLDRVILPRNGHPQAVSVKEEVYYSLPSDITLLKMFYQEQARIFLASEIEQYQSQLKPLNELRNNFLISAGKIKGRTVFWLDITDSLVPHRYKVILSVLTLIDNKKVRENSKVKINISKIFNVEKIRRCYIVHENNSIQLVPQSKTVIPTWKKYFEAVIISNELKIPVAVQKELQIFTGDGISVVNLPAGVFLSKRSFHGNLTQGKRTTEKEPKGTKTERELNTEERTVPWENSKLLYELSVDEGWTVDRIAEELGTDAHTVKTKLIESGIIKDGKKIKPRDIINTRDGKNRNKDLGLRIKIQPGLNKPVDIDALFDLKKLVCLQVSIKKNRAESIKVHAIMKRSRFQKKSSYHSMFEKLKIAFRQPPQLINPEPAPVINLDEASTIVVRATKYKGFRVEEEFNRDNNTKRYSGPSFAKEGENFIDDLLEYLQEKDVHHSIIQIFFKPAGWSDRENGIYPDIKKRKKIKIQGEKRKIEGFKFGIQVLIGGPHPEQVIGGVEGIFSKYGFEHGIARRFFLFTNGAKKDSILNAVPIKTFNILPSVAYNHVQLPKGLYTGIIRDETTSIGESPDKIEVDYPGIETAAKIYFGKWSTGSKKPKEEDIKLPVEVLSGGIIVLGATDRGKSRFGYHLIDELRKKGKKILVFDLKGEYILALKGTDLYFKAGDPEFPLEINPFEVYPFISEDKFDSYRDFVKSWIEEGLEKYSDISAAMSAGIMKAVEKTMEVRGNMDTFIEQINEKTLIEAKVSPKHVDLTITALLTRTAVLCSGNLKRVFGVEKSNFRIDEILNNDTVIDLSRIDISNESSMKFIVDYILQMIYYFKQDLVGNVPIVETKEQKSRNFILFDEAQRTIGKRSANERHSPAASLFTVARSYGITLGVFGNNVTQIDPTVLKSNVKVVFSNHEKDELIAYLLQMPVNDYVSMIKSCNHPRMAILSLDRKQYLLETPFYYVRPRQHKEVMKQLKTSTIGRKKKIELKDTSDPSTTSTSDDYPAVTGHLGTSRKSISTEIISLSLLVLAVTGFFFLRFLLTGSFAVNNHSWGLDLGHSQLIWSIQLVLYSLLLIFFLFNYYGSTVSPRSVSMTLYIVLIAPLLVTGFSIVFFQLVAQYPYFEVNNYPYLEMLLESVFLFNKLVHLVTFFASTCIVLKLSDNNRASMLVIISIAANWEFFEFLIINRFGFTIEEHLMTKLLVDIQDLVLGFIVDVFSILFGLLITSRTSLSMKYLEIRESLSNILHDTNKSLIYARIMSTVQITFLSLLVSAFTATFVVIMYYRNLANVSTILPSWVNLFLLFTIIVFIGTFAYNKISGKSVY